MMGYPVWGFGGESCLVALGDADVESLTETGRKRQDYERRRGRMD